MSLAAEHLAEHRGMLLRHCRRILGSTADAEDAVQETLVRAWRNLGRFEGRSSVRTWLHRIATNVCLDMRRRPALPVVALDEACHTGSSDSDPADAAATADQVRLAFVAALAQLPPRQRAVLILRDVLRWRASEVGELLGTSVASVNSALQRARMAMASHGAATVTSAATHMHAERYAAALCHSDIGTLVALVRAAS